MPVGEWQSTWKQGFWRAKLTGQDSQAGTILHELSHEVENTADYAYWVTDTLKLATDDPDMAVDNADNYEYFYDLP